MKGRAKKQRFAFSGEDDSILIGSHGDAIVQIEGAFELSGIIYCPKYIVTISIKGDGRASFRGKCNKIVVKKMEGNCTLDLTDVTCKELRCECMMDQATVLAGKTRVISQANLKDDARLHVVQRPLITNSLISGSSKIIHCKIAEKDLVN
jgi:hypothetical protein